MDTNNTKEQLLSRIKELESLVENNDIQQLKQNIIDNEERFKAFSAVAFEGIFITENGVCIEANQRICQMMGYSYDELIGLSLDPVIAPESKEIVTYYTANEISDPYEVIAVRKDGSRFAAEVRGQNYIYRNKKVRVVVARDISEYKQAQKNLIASENKFREVFENAGDSIIISALDGHILDINNSFCVMSGLSREEVLMRHSRTFFTEQSLLRTPLRFDLLDEGQSVLVERDIIGKNGEIIPIEMNSKRPVGGYYLSIMRDLRERKKAETELRTSNEALLIAKEKAEESDRLKSAFIANMSHEIRTPMNGIIGFTELLKQDDLSNEMRDDYLQIITNSGHQLLSIINDILEISRIETGLTTIESAPFNTTELIGGIVSFFSSMAKKKKNTIIAEVTNCENKIVWGDQSKIQQILTNLLNNSNKFTQNGCITIGIKQQDSDHLLFYVKDTGIGIPESYKHKIFDRFIQARHEGHEIQKGTGLGLSICKKLTELMHGKIWFESEVEKGSTFYFLLPMNAPSTMMMNA